MCRMIFAVGDINVKELIDDFITLAADQNEKHEKNIDKVFKHGDGWGIAYLENCKLKIFKSIKSVYEDPQIERFRDLETHFLILHARKASKGRVVLENVHPFELKMNGQRYLFFHNGTIKDKLVYDKKFIPNGTTDSEKYFYYLLTNSNGNLNEFFLKSRLEKVGNYTGANFILSNGAITYLTNWYSENPKYYTLKVLRKPGSIVVASEILPHYREKSWQSLENRDIISVNTADLKFRRLENKYVD